MDLKIFGKKSLNMVKVEPTKQTKDKEQTKDEKQTYNQNTLASVMAAVKITAELGYIATKLHDKPDPDAYFFKPSPVKYGSIKSRSNTKQKGGAIPHRSGETPGHLFHEFLTDSNITVVPAGRSFTSRLVILTLKESNEATIYTDYSARTFTNPVLGNIKQLIVKFVLVGNNTTYTHTNDTKSIEILTMEAFKNEIENLNDVAISTANNDPTGMYEKASPYVVFYTGGTIRPVSNENTSQDTTRIGININQPCRRPNKYKGCDDDESKKSLEQSIIDLFLHAAKTQEVLETDQFIRTNRSWRTFKEKLDSSVAQTEAGDYNVRLGVIAMTLAPGLDAYTSWRDSAPRESRPYRVPIFKESAAALIVEIIRVFFCAQLLHTDLHYGNYFINKIPEDHEHGRRVDKPYNYRVTLIDFGRTVSISTPDTFVKGSMCLDEDILKSYRKQWKSIVQDVTSDEASDEAKKTILKEILLYIISIATTYRNTHFTLVNALTALTDKFAATTPNEWLNVEPEHWDEIVTNILKYYKSCIQANTKTRTKIIEIWGEDFRVPPLNEIIDEISNKERGLPTIWRTLYNNPYLEYAIGGKNERTNNKKTNKKRSSKKKTRKMRRRVYNYKFKVVSLK
jgi:hypothetical protein